VLKFKLYLLKADIFNTDRWKAVYNLTQSFCCTQLLSFKQWSTCKVNSINYRYKKKLVKTASNEVSCDQWPR